MEGAAPDWQDGDNCYRCRSQFTLVSRKHHCRNCGNIFCAKCSSKQIPLPKLNIEKSVRVCDGCYEKLADPNQTDNSLPSNDNSNKSTMGTSDTSKNKISIKKANNTTSKTRSESAANASAPSEQELKEEEELQLALALSLSEAPKFTFPEIKQFENPESPAKKQTIETKRNSDFIASPNSQQTMSNPVTSSRTLGESVSVATFPNITTNYPIREDLSYQDRNNSIVIDKQLQGVDQDLRSFTEEIKSTSEVFTNRVSSNKLRNRPISSDSAIQGLFIKLTDMHSKLLEQIKIHDEERVKYEGLQDKLSQIADARAALDDLREEHQERVRQEAAEAERLRQSQLASKLEMMRQKKTQMMQYHRELALQRIQAQEMMLSQPQVSAPVNIPINNVPLPTYATAELPQQQVPPTVAYHHPQSFLQEHQLQQQQQHQQHQQQPLAPPPPQPQPQLQTQIQIQQPAKIEDDAPLISFDD